MKQFYIGNSKISGKGIIAGEDIPKGRVISRVKGPLKFKVNKSKEDAIANPRWIGVKKDIWIDPERPHKFLNHSCNPTAGFRGLTLISVRDIKEGEEITADYSTIEGDSLWEMSCSCGEKRCRKVIRSVEFLTPEQFESIPYIPAYFRKLYLNGNKNKKNFNKKNLV